MFTKYKSVHRFLSFIVILTMTLSGVQPSPVSAQEGDGIQREVNAETGKVSFIGPENGRVLPASEALNRSLGSRPADAALALAKRFAPEFGLANPEQDLSEMKSNSRDDGRLIVRYQQNYEGIPVMGGELIVNTNENGDLYSMNGEVSPDLSLQTQPEIDSEQGRESALQAVAKWYQKTPADFVASEPELWIYDESLLHPSTRPIELVWRMEVTSADNNMPVRELVLVNAQKGGISLHFNQIDNAWSTMENAAASGNRENVCLATDQRGVVGPVGAGCDITAFKNSIPQAIASPLVNTYTAGGTSSLPGTFLCDETQPNCTSGSNPQADTAHTYAIGTYNFYANNFNRDSIDNNGMVIISTVQYCDPDFACPYANAYWEGTEMVYGGAYGFANADDVVAHELTHGVTQYESGLYSYYQAGAIDESLSDVFGEYYDQTNGLGNDAPAVKWLLGEDVTGLGAIRNMKNPPQLGDPDKMTSSKYRKGISDSGGIHHNSGVNNKAVYLMVDGGAFNNKTVTGIGWEKTAAIYYEANTNLLTSGSDYSDLYFAIQQACINVTGQVGITSDDCIQVKNALLAVEMNKQPASNFNPDAPFCPANMSTDPSLVLYKDDFESGDGNWTLQNAWSLEDWYATSPTHMFYGNDILESNDSSLTMTTGVDLPAGSKTFLHFDHAFLFDYTVYQGKNYYFDGGVLEYSINNGSTWKDAKPLFSAGQKYKGTVFNYPGTTNTLKGRSAFVGDSHGYVSSLYNLSSLAGGTVRFRWRLGTDNTVAFFGWFVDNVQIYTCIPIPSKPVLKSPASNALVKDYTPDLDWSDSTPTPDHYQLQIATDSKFNSLVYDETSLPTSDFTVPADLDPNTKYYWRARAFNSINSPGAWSKVFSFRAVMLPPVLLTPTDEEIITSRKPTLDWDNVAGATKYNIQVSTKQTFSTKLFDASPTNSTYKIPSNLPSGKTIYWRVRAIGPNGPSNWSTVFSFVTP
jgi:Zn-dependent metalloprotease